MVWPINCVYYKINDMPPLKKESLRGCFGTLTMCLKKKPSEFINSCLVSNINKNPVCFDTQHFSLKTANKFINSCLLLNNKDITFKQRYNLKKGV